MKKWTAPPGPDHFGPVGTPQGKGPDRVPFGQADRNGAGGPDARLLPKLAAVADHGRISAGQGGLGVQRPVAARPGYKK